MLHKVVILIGLLLPFYCFSQIEATTEEISVRNNITYKNNKKFTGVLYSKVEANNECRCILEANYKDGLINGFKKEYFLNGKLKYKGEFSKGKKIGTHKYYDESGVLSNTKKYNNSILINNYSDNENISIETKKVLFSDIRYNNFLIGEWLGDKGGALVMYNNGRATYKYKNVNDAIDGKVVSIRWSYYNGILNLIFPNVTSNYQVKHTGANRISLYSINKRVFFDYFEKKSNSTKANNNDSNSKKGVKSTSNPINILISNSENGDASAQYNLATNYFNGIGVDKNINKAFFWYKKAAENGLVKAQEGLASMYYQRNDFNTAFIWYTKAANSNHPRAQYILGYMYRIGIGIKKSRKKAKFWWKKSCALGYSNSCNAIKQMNAFGNSLLNSVNESLKNYKPRN